MRGVLAGRSENGKPADAELRLPGVARAVIDGEVCWLIFHMSESESEFRSLDPLHGVTLEKMLLHLVDYHGWPGLADRIPVRCFMFDPSVTSSLKFLRKTPWARTKLEELYRRAMTE